MFIHDWELSKDLLKCFGVPRRSSVGLVVVIVGGLGGGRGLGGGTNTEGDEWVVGDGGVGVQGRAKAADSWCDRSREGSGSLTFWIGTSGSRKSSSDGGEGAGEELWVSVRPRKPQ